MNRQQTIKYFKACKYAGLPSSTALRVLLEKKATAAKVVAQEAGVPISRMIFEGIQKTPWIAGTLLAGLGINAWSKSTSVEDEIDKKQYQEAASAIQKQLQDKAPINLSTPQVGGGIVGGAAGMALGPTIFPKLDESSARLIGGVTGGVGGAIVGSLLQDEL